MRVDYEFAKLCDEIDRWRAEAEYWKGEYKRVQKEYIESINSSIKCSKKEIGIILNAVLDPDSIISKGHRAAALEVIKSSS